METRVNKGRKWAKKWAEWGVFSTFTVPHSAQFKLCPVGENARGVKSATEAQNHRASKTEGIGTAKGQDGVFHLLQSVTPTYVYSSRPAST